jgi:hypothetical protein
MPIALEAAGKQLLPRDTSTIKVHKNYIKEQYK